MNQLKRFTRAAIIALIALPGIASAGYILELNTLNGGNNFDSGTEFLDPTGYGFDLTISSFNSSGSSPSITNFTLGEGCDVACDAVGLGVVGGGSALSFLEALIFEFSEAAMLEAFVISVGSNETVRYSAMTPFTGGTAVIPSGSPSYLIDFEVLASSLKIENLSPGGQFRVSELHFAKVPEPSIIALVAAGLLGLGFARRRA